MCLHRLIRRMVAGEQNTCLGPASPITSWVRSIVSPTFDIHWPCVWRQSGNDKWGLVKLGHAKQDPLLEWSSPHISMVKVKLTVNIVQMILEIYVLKVHVIYLIYPRVEFRCKSEIRHTSLWRISDLRQLSFTMIWVKPTPGVVS